MLQMPQESRAGVVTLVSLCNPGVKLLLLIPTLPIPWTPSESALSPFMFSSQLQKYQDLEVRLESSRPGCRMPDPRGLQ